MAAYVIGQIDVFDPDIYKKYIKKVTAIVEQYGGRYLVRGGAMEVLEGKVTRTRMVVIEFKTVEFAQSWYDSCEYGPLKKLRRDSSSGELLIVKGLG